jgi:hypothetical protein
VRSSSFSQKMGEAGYSYSLTTFSPSGKLLQIEHALKAVQAGKTSLGIQGGAHGWGPTERRCLVDCRLPSC